jgi:hypothetical protein
MKHHDMYRGIDLKLQVVPLLQRGGNWLYIREEVSPLLQNRAI